MALAALAAAAWAAGALLAVAVALWPLQRVARAPVPHARVSALLKERPHLAAAATEGSTLGRNAFSAAGGEVRAIFVLCNSDGSRPWGWDFSGAAELLLAPALARLGPQLRVVVDSDVLFCPPLGGGGPGGRRGELPLEEVPARLQGAWGGLLGSQGGAGGEAGGGAGPAPELRFVLYLPDPAERPTALVAPDGRRSQACLVPDLGGVVLLGPGPLEAAEAKAAAASGGGAEGETGGEEAFMLTVEDLAPAFGAFLAQLGRLLGVERSPAAAGVRALIPPPWLCHQRRSRSLPSGTRTGRSGGTLCTRRLAPSLLCAL